MSGIYCDLDFKQLKVKKQHVFITKKVFYRNTFFSDTQNISYGFESPKSMVVLAPAAVHKPPLTDSSS